MTLCVTVTWWWLLWVPLAGFGLLFLFAFLMLLFGHKFAIN
jgi:hypothetical protein